MIHQALSHFFAWNPLAPLIFVAVLAALMTAQFFLGRHIGVRHYGEGMVKRYREHAKKMRAERDHAEAVAGALRADAAAAAGHLALAIANVAKGSAILAPPEAHNTRAMDHSDV